MPPLLFTHRHRVLPLTSLALVFFVSLLLISPLLLRASDMTSESVLALINAERTAVGLRPLQANAALSSAALAKANDMFERGYFSHTSPIGESPWQWIKQSGYSYQAAGENLAINYANAKTQHAAWMKSATHRANIMSAKYADTGIAVVTGKLNGESVTLTVQMFGTPRVSGVTSFSDKRLVPSVIPALAVPETVRDVAAVAPTEDLADPMPVPTPAVQLIDSSSAAPESLQWMRWLPTGDAQSRFSAWAFLVALVLFGSILTAIPVVLVGQAIGRSLRYWRQEHAAAAAVGTQPAAPETQPRMPSDHMSLAFSPPKRRLV